MTTSFNATATKTVGVNATNFEFTFTGLERIAFHPGKITTLGAEHEWMGATRALVATSKTLGAPPLLERVTAAMGPHWAGVFAGVVLQSEPSPMSLENSGSTSRFDAQINGGTP